MAELLEWLYKGRKGNKFINIEKTIIPGYRNTAWMVNVYFPLQLYRQIVHALTVYIAAQMFFTYTVLLKTKFYSNTDEKRCVAIKICDA